MENYKSKAKQFEEKIVSENTHLYDTIEKIGNIKCNDLDIKVIGTAGLSLIAWIPALISMPFVLKTGVLSIEALQAIYTITPLAVGVGAEQLLVKSLKNKERLKNTTDAKTAAERVEAATKLEIEEEKSIIEYSILSNLATEFYNKAEQEPDGFNALANETRTKAEIEESINGILKSINVSQERLDKLAIKSVLAKRFREIRNKEEKNHKLFSAGAIGAIAGILLVNAPVFIANIFNIATVNLSALSVIIPGILAGAAGLGVILHQQNAEKKAFEKLNEELLGADKLSETSDYEPEIDQRLQKSIKGKITELSSLRTFLEEEKTRKENKFGKEPDVLFEDFKSIKVTEKTRQHAVDHPELYQTCPPRIRQGKFYTDEEYEKRREEILNTPLPGEEEKGISFTKKPLK